VEHRAALLVTLGLCLCACVDGLPDGQEERRAALALEVPATDGGALIHLANRVVDVRRERPAQDRGRDPEAPGIHLVHFSGNIRAEWPRALQAAGLRILDYVPRNAYVVYGTLTQLRAARGVLEGLDWRGDWAAGDRLSAELAAGGDEADVTVYVAGGPESGATLGLLDGMTRAKLHADRSLQGMRVATRRVPRALLAGLVGRPDVYWVEPWRWPVLNDEVQGQILAGQHDGVQPIGPGYRAWYDAQPLGEVANVIVDVVDTGLDTGVLGGAHHPDLAGRLAFIHNYVSNEPNGNDASGHGTINASIVGGDATNGAGITDPLGFLYGEGLAPTIRLAGSAIFDDWGWFDMGDSSFTDLMTASHAAGARVSTNSWGSHAYGAYDSKCQEYDAIVRDVDRDASNGLQPMTVFFSAGNDGSGSYSIGSPATAKNIISIGASENYRMNGRDGCSIEDSGADSAADLIYFSSRGPTDDGRRKPDVVAPGTHVQGAASTDPDYDGSTVCDRYWPAGQDLYARSSGTSHSCPAAAGVGGMIHGWYAGSHQGAAPSPAMVKAILSCHTDDMAGGNDGAGKQLGNRPDTAQGWGRINMTRLFDPATQRVFVDQEQVFEGSGEEWVLDGLLVPDPTQPVLVSLSWLDAPGATTGSSYNNDLDLEVTVNGVTYLGNSFSGAWSTPNGSPDLRNNLENVFLPPRTATSLKVRVRASNLPSDGVPGNASITDQDFALYVYNATQQSPRGAVFLDAEKYGCSQAMRVTVTDEDIRGAGTIEVEVSSTTEPQAEVFVLTESVSVPGMFTGQVQLAPGEPVPDDHAVQARAEDVITATYHDADSGDGTPAEATARAVTDCTPPVIYGLSILAEVGRVTVAWRTSEPADSTLEYGQSVLLGAAKHDATLSLAHTVVLDNVVDCASLHLAVLSQDRYGNEARDDNQGQTYAAIAPYRSTVWTTSLDSDPGWKRDGDWQFDKPRGLSGDPGQAWSGFYVFGNDLTLDGAYASGADARLTTSYIDLLTSQAPAALTFRRWLTLAPTGSDAARVLAFDGVDWATVYQAPAGTFDTTWVLSTVDLSAYTGKVIKLQWQLQSDANGVAGGWNLDDLAISAVKSCQEGNRPPSCLPAVSPLKGTLPLEVQFDAGASQDLDGSIVRYQWDFGDGSWVDSPTAGHTYQKRGTYEARLTLVDDDGFVGSCVSLIEVNEAPLACFLPDQELLQLGEQVVLDAACSRDADGSVVRFDWELGDGSTAGGRSIKHLYDAAGTYLVRLVVTDDDGASREASQTVIVNGPPQAAFTWTPAVPVPGQVVAFDAGPSTDADGEVKNWTWRFGEGGRAKDTPKPFYVFSVPGQVTVGLDIVDNWGGVDSLEHGLRVNAPPVAALTALPATSVTQGATVQFDASDSHDPDGELAGLVLDFGDGEQAAGQALSHAYLCPGPYTAALTVTDADGATALATRGVMVLNAPPVILLGEDLDLFEGEGRVFSCQAGDLCPQSPLSFLWDFGDGAFAASPLAPHTFADDGDYTVRACVTDPQNSTACDTQVVHVANRAPVVDAGEDRTARQGEALTLSGSFTDAGTADTHLARWDFDDGTTAPGTLHPSHTWSQPGLHQVVLTVSDDDGGVGTDLALVEVANVPPAVGAGPDLGADEGQVLHLSGHALDAGGDAFSLLWDFGDGTTLAGSTQADHAWGDDGTFTATLTATDQHGGVGTASARVSVRNVAPRVEAGPDLTTVEGTSLALAASFTDPGLHDQHTWRWEFDDGASSGQPAPQHTWRDDGAFVVSVAVTDDDGGVGSDALTVTVVNAAPVVHAGADQAVQQWAPVSLFGAFTDAGAGDTHTFTWDFGDGTPPATSLATEHVFKAAGSFTVTLTVRDDDGGVGSDALTVVVADVAPLVEAGPDRAALEGQVVSFSGTVTDQGAAQPQIRWDFGDGTSTEGTLNPQHVYADDGVFVVTLTAMDAAWNASVDSLVVTVANVPPTVQVGLDRVVDEGQPAHLEGSWSDPGGADVLTVAWSSQDGFSTQGVPGFSHVFADDGVYGVCLRVSDDDGGTAEDCATITVRNLPPAFTSDAPLAAAEDEEYQYLPTATDPAGAADPLAWTLAQGPAGMKLDPLTGRLSWTPRDSDLCGPRDVLLKAEDDDGGQAWQAFQLELEPLADPPAVLSTPPTSVVQGFLYTYFALAGDDDLQAPCLGETLAWSLPLAPAGMALDAAGGTITWNPTNLDVGTHQVLLRVTDSAGLFAEQAFPVNVTPHPQAPVAIAGPDRSVKPGFLTLDGGNSYPTAALAAWTWSQLSGPALVEPQGCEGARCRVILTAGGEYVYRLVVADQSGRLSPPDDMTITLQNVAPVADAGPDRVVEINTSVQLSAAGSSDVNGDALAFTWSLPGDGAELGATLTPDDAAGAIFSSALPGTFVVGLVAHDGQEASAPAYAHLTVVDRATPQRPPAALPWPVRVEVTAGQPATLDGRASLDPEGQALSWRWDFVSGPAVVLAAEQDAALTSVTPAQPGAYRFWLTVNDGALSSWPAEVLVLAHPQGGALPRATATDWPVAPAGTSAGLDASASEGAASFSWAQSHGPSLLLDDPTSPTPAFDALKPGTARFTLEVADAAGARGEPLDAWAFVVSPGNHPPVADAGQDRELVEPTSVTLDGSASQDPDGEPLAYQWEQVSGPPVVLSDPTVVNPSFVPAGLARYGFRLTVRDLDVASAPAQVALHLVHEQAVVEEATPEVVEPTAEAQEAEVTGPEAEVIPIEATDTAQASEPGPEEGETGGGGCSFNNAPAPATFAALLLVALLLLSRRRGQA
jgi:PKD repeat protein